MKYGVEWISGPALIGAVLLLLIVPPFALIALAVVAVAAVAALVALTGAILATPYLLARTIRRRLAERQHRSVKGTVPIAGVLAQPTTARRAA